MGPIYIEYLYYAIVYTVGMHTLRIHGMHSMHNGACFCPQFFTVVPSLLSLFFLSLVLWPSERGTHAHAEAYVANIGIPTVSRLDCVSLPFPPPFPPLPPPSSLSQVPHMNTV